MDSDNPVSLAENGIGSFFHGSRLDA
jgi:hypothetical protein